MAFLAATRSRFGMWLTVTCSVAAISFLTFGYEWLWGAPLPAFLKSDDVFTRSLLVVFAYCMLFGPAVWLLMTVALITIFKRRGLWALIGLPFAAAPIAFIGLLYWSCATGPGCV